MDHLMMTVLVKNCPSLCYGCKDKFKKLKKDIPQIQFEFDTERGTATISGAVDPAIVRKKLKDNKIACEILREKRSPINHHHHHHQTQIASPKPSVTKAVVHFGDFPSEIAGTRTQDVPIVKRTPDRYLMHEHKLVKVERFKKRFACDSCKEDGFNLRYRCERCNFDLHPECRSPKPTISPEIHKELVFEFRPQKPPSERLFCDACGKGIHGCFYNRKVKDKRMDLHPCCAKLKAQERNDDVVLTLREKVSSECLRCRKKVPPGTEKGIPGWCYVSECNKYNVHIHCITQMLHEAWQRGLTDHTSDISVKTIHFERMTVAARNRGRKGIEALKIISIFRMIIGVVLGDPSVFFASLMVELLEKLL